MAPPHRLPSRYNAIVLFPPHYHPPPWFDPQRADEILGPIAVLHFAGPWFKPWNLNVSITESTASTVPVWCKVWLEVFYRIKANQWRPLPLVGPDSMNLHSFLPNPKGYEHFPKATVAPVPYLRGAHVPHEQVVLAPFKAGTGKEGFVTVLLNESHFVSVAVWATSLQQHHSFSSWRKTLLLVSSEIKKEVWAPLTRLFNFVKVVDPIKIARKKMHLPSEFMLLHLWNLKEEFDRLVFVDPLSLFVDNCNDLFRFETFAAVPAVFPSDTFSSRVMVIQPNSDLFLDLVKKLNQLKYGREKYIDRYLNAYFFDWFQRSPLHRLPTSYAVDVWFKEGLMKFFLPWKIIIFDSRGPPWMDISDWTSQDRTRAVKLWRRTLCSLEDEFKPVKLDILCGEIGAEPANPTKVVSAN